MMIPNGLLRRAVCVALMMALLALTGGTVLAADAKVYHDKFSAPSWQGPLEEMAEYALEEIGITWETIGYPTTDMHQTAVRTSLPSSRAPEMFTWWSDFRMEALYKTGGLVDVTAAWDARADEYNPALRAAFEFEGRVYGVPSNLAYWSMWYNKAVFEEHGLELPKTWDEFVDICDYLLGEGITPLAHTVQGRWPTFIWFQEILTRLDPDAYEALMIGEINYDDPTVREAFDIWQGLIEAGYFVDPGTDLFAEVPRMFANGQVAMILIGDWYTDGLDSVGLKAGVDYDTFILPAINEEVGNVIIYEAAPILFGKNAPNAEAALELADWWLSPETQARWCEILGFIPPNAKSDASFLMAPKKDLLNEINEAGYRLVNRYWEATPTEICEAAVDEFARFILNPDQKDDVINTLVTIADRYWAAQ
ncbi:MAG: extracellular solute-binding protein [Firmicutes bacterium]|jgi:multiple sugar transport system substrate-binding protein|nr:extracellular solute-binding protein [Bacillota bacterium]